MYRVHGFSDLSLKVTKEEEKSAKEELSEHPFRAWEYAKICREGSPLITGLDWTVARPTTLVEPGKASSA